MQSARCLTAWGLALLGYACGSHVAAIDVRTGSDSHRQRFEAWGTSLAWMGNELGGSSNTARRDQMMEMLFDQDNGLGLNFVRYNIGAGQNPNGPAITRAGGDMDGWVPDAPTDVSDPNTWAWDWNADETQRLILDKAIEHGVSQVEAFANSAPWWMTVALSSRGNPNTGQTNLHIDNYDVFGHYLLEVTEHFEANLGIHFHSLAPMNEPGATWWNGGNNQEGMHIPVGSAQSALVREIGQQIVDRGLDTGLVGPEETAIRWTVNSYDNWGAQTRSFITQINTHSYPWGGGSDAADAAALVAYNESRPEGPKKIYATEFGTGGNSTPLSGGITLANQITSDINNLGAAGWTYWQAVEDNNGSNWGLMIAPFDGTNSSFDTRRQYYAMKQFSQHIRPGSQILNVSDEEVVASYDLRTGTTTLVITNDETPTGDTRTFDLLDQDAKYSRVIRTSDSEFYQSLGAASLNPAGNQVSVSTPGSTVTTVQLHHRPNLIRNHNFDLGGAANGNTSIPNWQAAGNAAFDTGSDHSADGSGTGRLETNSTANSGSLFQTGIGDADTDLTGMAFQLSVDVRFLSGGSRSYRADTYLAIEFYGADDQALTHVAVDDFQTLLAPANDINSDSHNDNEYRTYQSGRFVAPAGTRYVRPVISFDSVNLGATDWSFIDNAYLQEVHPEAEAKEWAIASGGDWSDGRAWLGHALAENNKRTYFGNAISEASAVSLDSTEAIEGMTFLSENEYHLQGTGKLEVGIASSQEAARIDARLGSHRISLPTEIVGRSEIQVLPGASLSFDGGFDLSGQLLWKLGAGVVDFDSGFDMDGGIILSYLSPHATMRFGTDAVLDSSLIMLLAPGQEIELGDLFEVITYTSLGDTFDSLSLPQLSEGLQWDIDYGPQALTVEVVAMNLPGDFNDDGTVDAADYTHWRDNLGALDSVLNGNGDGLGFVNAADLVLWKDNFGATAAGSAAVPEPTSGLVCLALVLLCRLWQRKGVTTPYEISQLYPPVDLLSRRSRDSARLRAS